MTIDIRPQLKSVSRHILRMRNAGSVAANDAGRHTAALSDAFLALPVSAGRDLVELVWMHQRTSVPGIFDLYGIPDAAAAKFHTPFQRLELRIYANVVGIVRACCESHGIRMRPTTVHRMASSIIEEVLRQRECSECRGTGALEHDDCPCCAGSRLERTATSWRAEACGCNRNDFRGELDAMYQDALCAVAEIERETIDVLRHSCA